MKVAIDGRSLEADPGESILDCALRHEIDIPRLCTHPSLPAFGACRMCVVEVDGARGFPSSCTTPVVDGMVVRTDTESLRELRKGILELILVEHPSACLLCGRAELCDQYRPKPSKAGRATGCHTCSSKDHCEVRDLSDQLGVEQLPVPPTYRGFDLERSDPFIDRDLNLCILCGRCVRICKAQQSTAVIDFVGRGADTHIGTAFGRSLAAADCRFCGSCIDVCPTGSLTDRYGKWFGDPTRWTDTTCMFCDAACAIQIGATAHGRAVTARAANPAVPICLLGRFGIPEVLRGRHRFTCPSMRSGNEVREVPWEEALAAAAEKLQPHRDGGFALVCDTTCTLEDRRVFERFTSEVMRSPHYLEIRPDPRGVARADLPAGTRAALLTGDFIDTVQLAELEVVVVVDCYATPASDLAHVVLPAAIFAEVDGTWHDSEGRRRVVNKACDAPGEARPDWQTVRDLARALGAEGFDYGSAASVGREIEQASAGLWIEREVAPAAALDSSRCRTHFRGHRLTELIRGLEDLAEVGQRGETAGG